MDLPENKVNEAKTYVVSLLNRKARGSGHERCKEILGAARALFLEHGVENVTTRQIACRVGISQTALYVYFKNKEEILDKLVAATLESLIAILKAVESKGGDPIDSLRASFRAYVHFAIEHPDEFRLIFTLRDRRRVEGICIGECPLAASLLTGLQSRIEQGVASGALRDLKDPSGVAQSVWASMHGLVSLLIAYPNVEWIETERLIELHIEMLLNGLARRDDRGGRAPALVHEPALLEAVASPVSATPDLMLPPLWI
jgi:AcrR family transcriptional regulator